MYVNKNQTNHDKTPEKKHCNNFDSFNYLLYIYLSE